MGWASEYIEKLKKGETVEFRPTGGSMTGFIESGQMVRVIPLGSNPIFPGMIVLCEVDGREYLHFVKRIDHNLYQIGNAKGGINGWILKKYIYGILTWVDY